MVAGSWRKSEGHDIGDNIEPYEDNGLCSEPAYRLSRVDSLAIAVML